MGFFTKKFELYHVFDGEDNFYITNSNKFITHNGIVYEPATADRSKIELKPEMEKQSVEMTVDIDHPLAKKYLLQSIESVATLRITENYDGNFYSLWRGRLVNTSIDGNSFNMKFENNVTKQLRSGAYRRYQRTCPYALYGKNCKANKDEFSSEWQVAGFTRGNIRLVGQVGKDSNYFSGGMIETENGDLRFVTSNNKSSESSLLYDRRTVITATEDGDNVLVTTDVYEKMPYSDEKLIGSVSQTIPLAEFTGELGVTENFESYALQEMDIVIFNQFQSGRLDIGDTVKVYAGCDKLNTTCSTKFNNILNFGGFPFIPQDNPFTGTII